MTQREKTLGLAVAAAGVLWFGTQGVQRYKAAVERNENVQFEAERQLDDANLAVERGQRARHQLNKWRRRSLPTGRDVAESLYQDWLRGQLTAAGLTVKDLADKSALNRRPEYTELSASIDAEGTLAQLSNFLHAFYTAPHLHRISAATLTPAKEGGKLTIALTVDALILPDADRTDALADRPPQELPKSADDFRKSLEGRNLFAAYTPKADGQATAGPDGDAADAKISSMVSDGNRGWRLSVLKQKSSEVSHYHEGDSIKIGRFEGKVIEIDGPHRRAVFETPAGRVELRLSQTFDKATPVTGDST
jgi:hypothetical protein